MSAAAISSAPVEQKKAKKTVVTKPEKPDQAKFEKDRDAAEKDLKKVQDELKTVRDKIDLAKPGGQSPRQIEIKTQLRDLRAQLGTKRDARGKLEDQIKSLDTSIKGRISEIKSSKDSLRFKTLDTLENEITRLQKSVDSGQLRIVEERKALSEISSLGKQRKIYGELEAKQSAIDEDRAKAAELRKGKDDPERRALEDKIKALQDELEEIKKSQDVAFADLNALRDQRTKLQESQNVKWQHLQRVKDEYFAARKAHREWENEAWKIRRARQAEAEAERRREQKRAIAKEKMDAASTPAFASQILTCEGLIGFFDPSSAEAARKAKLTSTPSTLAAQPSRKVDDSLLKGKKLVKDEEDYFVGGGGKKGKGKKNRGAKNAAPSGEGEEGASAGGPSGGKFNLSAGIFEELAVVGVEPPANAADVPKTLEALREKVKWYRENQEKVTQENIAKAKKELEKLEAEEAGTGSTTPKENGTDASTPVPAEPTSETKTETEAEAAEAEVVEESKEVGEEEEKADAEEKKVEEEVENSPAVEAEAEATKDE